MTTEQHRLAKVIADSGLCSRRAASRLIEAGRVNLNGRLAVHHDYADQTSLVTVDNQPLPVKPAREYWLYHKQAGTDCNLNAADPDSLYQVLKSLPTRLYPCGRLDKDSRGLLLLTSDGVLTQRLLHPSQQHEKEYLVTVNASLTEHFLQCMAAGVSWQVGPHHYHSRPCTIKQTAEQQFRLILTEGQNRQIRYMCRALGYKVTDLCRIRIENLQLGALPAGALRQLTPEELNQLLQQPA